MLLSSEGLLAFGFVVVVFSCFWAFQFMQLMSLSDEDFPGRHDKILWVIGMVFGNFAGALAFFLWKKLMVQVQSLQRETDRERTGKP